MSYTSVPVRYYRKNLNGLGFSLVSNRENFFRKDINPLSKKKEILANFEKEAKKKRMSDCAVSWTNLARKQE